MGGNKIGTKLEEDLQYAKVNEHLLKTQGKTQGDLKKVLEENLKYTKAIYEDTQKIRRYMFIRMVINFIWIIFVIAPIIVALIWLPPLLGDILGPYQDLLGEGQNALELFNQIK